MRKSVPSYVSCRYALVIMALSTAACTSTVTKNSVTGIEQKLGRGWQCLLVPSGAYSPGYVFRMDKSGVEYTVNQKLAASISALPYEAAIGAISDSRSYSLGVIASVLNLRSAKGENLAQANASFNSTHVLEAKFEGETRVVADDEDVQSVLDWFSSAPKKGDNRYFVVREAMTASGVELKINKTVIAQLGGSAQFTDAVKADPSLRYDPRAAYDLSKKFAAPLKVCMKPEELVVDSSGITGPEYKAVAVEQPLAISGHGGEDASE